VRAAWQAFRAGQAEHQRQRVGARVRARVNGMDLLTLELHATLAARLDAPAEVASGAGFEAAPAEDESEDDAEPAGTLKLAIDLDDGAAAAEPGTAPAEPAAS